MSFKNILQANCTRAKVASSSKKRALEDLAQLFANTFPEMEADTLFHQFIARERLGSTGIGGAIAIPHCRFNTGGKTFAACITLDTPIDFDAIDSKPVDIIFSLVVPEDAEAEHLELLSELAEALLTPGTVDALRNAKSDDHLHETALQHI